MKRINKCAKILFLTKDFTALNDRTNLISYVTLIRDPIIKVSLKSYCGCVRHLFSSHIVSTSAFYVWLVISFNLDKTLTFKAQPILFSI